LFHYLKNGNTSLSLSQSEMVIEWEMLFVQTPV
jgi:hypothetical protein